jgi:hypothetical protein
MFFISLKKKRSTSLQINIEKLNRRNNAQNSKEKT